MFLSKIFYPIPHMKFFAINFRPLLKITLGLFGAPLIEISVSFFYVEIDVKKLGRFSTFRRGGGMGRPPVKFLKISHSYFMILAATFMAFRSHFLQL